jgi:1-acyl-sn-glycerol-3-phosphate acyltransferase
VLQSLFAFAAVIVLTIVMGTGALLLSLFRPRGDWVIRLGRLWARGISAASGVTVEASGVENVPLDRPAILLSNHASNFDMIALLMTIPRSFRVVAKRFLFHIPIFGWCLRVSGMIPIDREKRARAILSLEKAAERIRTGQPVLFFPEGTRSPDGRLLPFKKGAFVIAVKSGVPIIPVSVTGSSAVLAKKSIRIRPGRIVVRFGPEIPVAEYTLETKELLMARVREAIAAGMEEPHPGTPPALGAGSGATAPTA